MDYEEAKALEEDAKRLTWHAWIDRDVGRLFPLPEIHAVRQRVVKPYWWGARNKRVWDYMDDLYWGKAVGVVPPLENMYEKGAEESCIAGIWTGIGPDWFGGSSLKLTNFSGPGCTRHRSPYNIGFIFILPERFQRIAETFWDDEGDYRCGGCSYLFKELPESPSGEFLREEACHCHFLCASCCSGERAREAIEAQTQVKT